MESRHDLKYNGGNYPQDEKIVVTRTGYTGEDGFEVALANE